jgi:hypothetical protein
MSTPHTLHSVLLPRRLPSDRGAQALTRAAGRLSRSFHCQVMLPQLAEHVRARVCKSGLARQSSAGILALPFSPPLSPAGRPGQLDLLARRQRDERRGAVSVLTIPLSLGCPVLLPPCPSACGTESGEPSLVIGSGAVHLSPHPAEPLPFPADTRHNLALAECFCREPRARQTGALTRGRRCKAWAWPLSRPFFA